MLVTGDHRKADIRQHLFASSFFITLIASVYCYVINSRVAGATQVMVKGSRVLCASETWCSRKPEVEVDLNHFQLCTSHRHDCVHSVCVPEDCPVGVEYGSDGTTNKKMRTNYELENFEALRLANQ